MPHIFVLAAAGVSIYYGFRWMRNEYDRVDASLRRAERRIRRASSNRVVPLVFDASTGFYTPSE